MFIQRKRRNVLADTEIDPAATDLLFETEDVAELVSEVTGEPVEVTSDEDRVTFTVGDDEYTVTPEGDEEILESSRKVLRGKRTVQASSKSQSKVIRKVPSRR